MQGSRYLRIYQIPVDSFWHCSTRVPRQEDSLCLGKMRSGVSAHSIVLMSFGKENKVFNFFAISAKSGGNTLRPDTGRERQ
mmetsp:Transcript_81764/g.144267  ORF Transcript_81764/g.144267 Transcript_81764/m.144267 type:complete len:81 (-) Transcript_81764:90-332(-)